MTNKSVINLGTRRPVEEEEAERREMERQHERFQRESAETNKAEMLDLLDKVRKLVLDEAVDSLALAARNPENGIFLSDVCISKGAGVDVYTSFTGKLDMLKLETADIAMSGPHMMPDGTYFCLEAQLEGIEVDE